MGGRRSACGRVRFGCPRRTVAATTRLARATGTYDPDRVSLIVRRRWLLASVSPALTSDFEAACRAAARAVTGPGSGWVAGPEAA